MITSLRLQNFRSYIDGSFEFDPGVNIVVGPNACGKTNLLEAVLVLARGGSYRAKDVELITSHHEWARLDGFFESENRSVKYQNLPTGLIKSFTLDDKPLIRLPLEKTVPVVLFEPNDLQLLIRGPEQRREYIDSLLEQSQSTYKALKNNYKRVVAQRNTLLKQRGILKDQFFVWNIRLSELGGKIVEARGDLIKEINQNISKNYSSIAKQKSDVKLRYQTDLPLDNYSSSLLKKLETDVEKDKLRGFTAYGPHREDILFTLNGEQAEKTASRGETRTILLALKIFELDLLEKRRGKKPILLLDDVFSELDGSRRRYLVEFLKDHQTIITTTDADAVVAHFTKGYNLIAVN